MGEVRDAEDFSFTIEQLSYWSGQIESDIRGILETWIKDSETGEPIPDEINEDLKQIRQSAMGENNLQYFIAKHEGEIIGFVGLRPMNLNEKLDKLLFESLPERNPVGLATFYIHSSYRGKGIGTNLMDSIKGRAKESEYTDIFIRSGPRYRSSGWGFYRKTIGSEYFIMENYYDDAWPCHVWRIDLTF